MNNLPVKVTAEILTASSTKILAIVKYTNVSDEDIWILHDSPNLFVTCDGEEIEYIGILEKRSAYTMNDYEKIPPKQSTLREVNIADKFAYLSGEHQYKLLVPGGYNDPISKKTIDGPIISVDFTVAK